MIYNLNEKRPCAIECRALINIDKEFNKTYNGTLIESVLVYLSISIYDLEVFLSWVSIMA